MKWSEIFLVLGLAAVISAATSYLIAPNLPLNDQAPSTASMAIEATPSMNANVATEVRRAATLQLRGDGHYWARALVNNKASVEFMVDTGASVVIESIKINQVHIRNVEAMVLPEALDQSLLGMSFLRELYSYEFRGERMIIRQ